MTTEHKPGSVSKKPKEFCGTCGEELLRCKGCGEIIRKNLGWQIIFNTDVPGSYHHDCAKTLVRHPLDIGAPA